MSTPLGVAVVGAGFWANEMHLPALAAIPGVVPVVVHSRTADAARQTAQRHGVPRWTDDLSSVLRDPAVDVVDIVAPPDTHAALAMAAARHGKDVICIKPLARSTTEADAMIAAAAAHDTRLLYAENVPFVPAVREATALVRSGAVGDVFRVKACEGIGEPHAPWFFSRERSGGGALLDMAVHSIAFCRHVVDQPIVSVYAETGTFMWADRTDAEDTAVLVLRFAGGAIGQCEDSWSLAGAMDSRFEIFGTSGRVQVDNLHRQPVQLVSDASGGWTSSSGLSPTVGDGHVDMLEHLLDCLRTGQPSRSEAAAGRDVLAVVEAAYRSAVSGRREQVDGTVNSDLDGAVEVTA